MIQTLYGFARTVCACDACIDKCRAVSGMAVPEDLLRWQTHHGPTFPAWALAHLAASPGALVMRDRQIVRIPTIVPARLSTGACIFLTGAERCRIHDEAPYGCAYFDHQMSNAEGNRRSRVALASIAYDWEVHGPYSQLWTTLYKAGRTVDAPEIARQRLTHP